MSGDLYIYGNTNYKEMIIDYDDTTKVDNITYLKHDMSLVNGSIKGCYEVSYYNEGRGDGAFSGLIEYTVYFEGKFIDGKEEGVHKFWKKSMSGKLKGTLLKEVTYKNGLKDGLLKRYNRMSFNSEHLRAEEMYKNDKKNGVSKYYFDNGRLNSEITYLNDKKNGISKLYKSQGWHPSEPNNFQNFNHWLESETMYKNDKKDGLFRSYFLQGELAQEGNYKDGQMVGVWREWNHMGKLKMETTYEYGYHGHRSLKHF